MKIIVRLLLIALLVSTNGCMTYNVVQDAKGHPERAMWFHRSADKETEKQSKAREERLEDTEPHPAYYAWIPLTVVGDIALSPIEIIFSPVLYVGLNMQDSEQSQ